MNNHFLDFMERMPRTRQSIELTAQEDIKKGRMLEYYGRWKRVRHARKAWKGQRLAGLAEYDAKRGQKVWVTYHGSGDAATK